MARFAHDAPADLARAADGEDVRRAEPQRGRDRRVLAEASVEVELAIDPHGGEEQRDGGAGEGVVRSDAIGPEQRARGNRRRHRQVGRRLHEDDRAPRRDLGTGDREGAEHPATEATRQRAPADLPLHELRHGPDVEEPVPVAPPEEHAGQREDLPDAEPEHPSELDVAPQIHEPAQAEDRIGEVGRQVARVDGADARAAEDVDARRAPEDPRQIVEDVPEDPHLVSAARPAPRQDHRDPALAVFPGKARHADSGPLGVTTRGEAEACRSSAAHAVTGTGVVSKSAALAGRFGKSLRSRGSRTVRMRAFA